MLLTITHKTLYSYDTPVHYALQRMRLTPQDGPQQKVLDWAVDVVGARREVSFTDQHGNLCDLINADAGTTEISITARGRIDTRDTNGVLGDLRCPAPLWHYRQQTPLTAPGDGVKALAAPLPAENPMVSELHDLSDRIRAQVPYQTQTTFVATTAEEAVLGGKGVCQDHAQIFVSAARCAGIPARYVSGYLMLNDEDDQDASHAWAEAYLHGLGWVGFDVSNGYSPDERYVRLATGLDYRDAAPLIGLRQGPGAESMIVSVQIQQ